MAALNDWGKNTLQPVKRSHEEIYTFLEAFNQTVPELSDPKEDLPHNDGVIPNSSCLEFLHERIVNISDTVNTGTPSHFEALRYGSNHVADTPEVFAPCIEQKPR